jgi:hypothetical protein
MKIPDAFTVAQETAHERFHLDADMFSKRAYDLIGLIDELRGELGLPEAINVAIDRFVDDESHPELRRFSEVLVLGRRQALLQQQLDEDREELHKGRLSHEELTSLGHHYETLRHEACTYNHLLRGVIESNGQYFSRDDIERWLTSTSQGRHQWARGEVTGSVSEIALHAALEGLPELRNLRYATVEEDLAGYDFVATWHGRLLTVDAKTGFYQPLSERKHGHKHLEISVPREAVRDFRVTRRGLDILRHEVRQALFGETAANHHASHSYFRPATA